MWNRKLTIEQANEIRAAYWLPRIRDGLDPGEIPLKDERDTIYPTHRGLAKRYGISTYAVHRIISGKSYRSDKRVNPPDRRQSVLSADEKAYARERWQAGDSLRTIAAVLGMTPTGVWYHVKGIPAPPKKWSRRSVERLSDALTTATSAA